MPLVRPFARLVRCRWSLALGVGLTFAVGEESRAFYPPESGASAPNELANHPVRPALELAYRMRENLRQVQDYSCVFVKRERIDGKLGEHEHLQLKVRHAPFSVYTRFESPKALAGREAIYVEGKHNNQIQAHGTGFQKLAGTLSLDPNGSTALRGSRFPITQAGLRNSVERLIRSGEEDLRYAETEVQFLAGAAVNGRPATVMQIVHPHRRKHFSTHLTRIYIDDEWQIPVRSELYDWPAKAGEQPGLIFECTYTKLKFNQGLTDLDFDVANPAYDFR